MIEIELDLKNNNRRLRGYNISSKETACRGGLRMILSALGTYLDTGPGIWEILLRMALTAVFVGVIGIERQLRQKIAGVTTHLMVAFGACGIAILQDRIRRLIDSLQQNSFAFGKRRRFPTRNEATNFL